MTREEAIELLDNLIGMVEDNHEADYDTAIKMAIKSLNQEPRFLIHSDGRIEQFIEPCDNCVSRQAVRDRLKECNPYSGDWFCERYVDEIPSVNPTRVHGEWLRVEDGLPKDGEQVIILLKHFYLTQLLLTSFDETKARFYRCDRCYGIDDVIAWMSIPKYEGVIE